MIFILIVMVNISNNARIYLTNIPTEIKLSEFPLTRINPAQLETFQRGIPVFEGLKMPDIAFLTKNFSTINFFRGCKSGCLHCIKNALAPNPKKPSIIFEDLRALTRGMRLLSERLGFNILNGNKFINIAEDSNPFDTQIRGLTRSHSLVDGIKQVYNNLNIPVFLSTSGWTDCNNRGYVYSSHTANKLTNYLKSNPDAVKEVRVIISPFMESFDYTAKMARAMYAFLDLFKIDKARVVCKHTKNPQNNYDANACAKIYNDIFNKLKEMTGVSLDAIPQLNPEKITSTKPQNWVEQSGRAKNFYSKSSNMEQYNFLLNERAAWKNKSEQEKAKILLNDTRKCIDIDGSVYCAKKSRLSNESTLIEINIPSRIQLNFSDKTKPNPIYNEIEY